MSHPEIEVVRNGIWALLEKQKAYLAGKPAAYVEELLHRAEDDLKSDQFTRRTAAEINRTACVLLRQKEGSSF